MDTNKLLQEFEVTLDQLIHNAKLLHHTDPLLDGCFSSIEERQEYLLDRLFSLHREMRDETIPSPSVYGMLEKKIHQFSHLNWQLLNEPRKRTIKKARVHRNRNKSIEC